MHVLRIPKNTVGTDYVVGDIHGCFDLLEAELQAVNFNRDTDRLFSVGDLVDRGPDSGACLMYLDQPWFYAVRGNHEEMAIEFLQGKWPIQNYWDNGGKWFYLLTDSERERYAGVFEAMPLALEVETDTGLVGIIHAEVPENDWASLYTADADDQHTRAKIMWSRTKIRSGDRTPVANIDRVYVGHTVIKEYGWFSNVCYLDTGAVFGSPYKLTVRPL